MWGRGGAAWIMGLGNLPFAARINVAALAAAGLLLAAPPAAAQGNWPSRVSAVYRIEAPVVGNIGTFRFESKLSSKGYVIEGHGDLKGAAGAFSWVGNLRSSGTLTANHPKPADYVFDYRSYTLFKGMKSGSVRMAFDGTRVTRSVVLPPNHPHPDAVPVSEAHLADVFDPLSAVMALSRAKIDNPCGRSIAVFDGKQRFELKFDFRRQLRISEAQPSGQPAIAYVCNVRYHPVAGHRMNRETKDLMAATGIEVAFRPIPSANLMVPYQIVIPLPIGTAILTSERVDIVTAGQKSIALVY